MNVKDHKHSERVFFKAVGLSDVDDDLFIPRHQRYVKTADPWPMRRLSTIMKELGHEKVSPRTLLSRSSCTLCGGVLLAVAVVVVMLLLLLLFYVCPACAGGLGFVVVVVVVWVFVCLFGVGFCCCCCCCCCCCFRKKKKRRKGKGKKEKMMIMTMRRSERVTE